jgi:hypothetical protein
VSALTAVWAAAMTSFALSWALTIQAWRKKAERFWADAAVTAGDALLTVWAAAGRNVTLSLFFAALTVLMAFICRMNWRKRKRRRQLAAIGAKSRARIAAMTARMRERPARPVLRPVPGGAR